MQHHLDDLDLLTDVSGTDSKLLHLLTCPECRSFAISRLLELSVEADEDGEMADYEPVFERLSQLDPVRLDDARARRAEAERLLQELMASPAEERLEALHNVCFHSADLLDFLLEQSHTRQIQAPEQAAELALLAAQLAAYLASEDEEMAEPLVRALCLEVNALRLGGDLEQAEVLIEKAAVFTDSWEDRAFYCRTLALALVSEGGQLASIVSLVGSLEPPPGSCAAALNLGIQALETLEHCSETGEAALEKAVKLTSDTLRRTFRTCGVALRPLPFA